MGNKLEVREIECLLDRGWSQNQTPMKPQERPNNSRLLLIWTPAQSPGNRMLSTRPSVEAPGEKLWMEALALTTLLPVER